MALPESGEGGCSPLAHMPVLSVILWYFVICRDFYRHHHSPESEVDCYKEDKLTYLSLSVICQRELSQCASLSTQHVLLSGVLLCRPDSLELAAR